jgi:hypothetical protein
VAGSLNTDFTVPLLPANAALTTVPKACLTVSTALGASLQCPALGSANPLLNNPVEIMYSEPTAPVCGGATTCTQNRVIACYASGTDCPASYGLRLYKNLSGVSSTPEPVECRQLRTVCDLTSAGMGSNNPNAFSYDLAVTNGQALDGCISIGSTACPPGYPFPTYDVGGALTGCSKNTTSSCGAGQIPQVGVSGAVEGCQQQQSAICPANYPITVRENLLGLRVGCIAAGITQCPAGYSFPTYGVFNPSTALIITNCFKDNVVQPCSSVVIAQGDMQPRAGGTYNTAITSNSTGTPRTLGCVQSTATTCPGAAFFAFMTFNIDVSGTTSTTIDRCAPASEVVTCGGTYPKPAYTKSVLTACINHVVTNGMPGLTTLKCPAAYPLVVTTVNDPALITNQNLISACMSASSTCWENSPTGTPFTIITNTELAFCVPIVGLSSCAAYPVAAYTTGVMLYRPDGGALVGCT